MLPNGVKEMLYYRYFHARHERWRHLFEAAPLATCPEVKMHRLVPGDVISGNIAFHGFYEWQLTRRVIDAARGGGCFVDVGANMGYFSLLWAAFAPAGKVFAFEPSPRNVQLLANNVALNGFADRVTVVPKAAGHQPGSIRFDIGPSEQTGWGRIANGECGSAIEVPLVRLDEELGDREIAVLKIDTEGADALVIKGAEALLKRQRIATIFFEQHPLMAQLGIREGEAQAYLRGFGYHCQEIDDNEWMARRSGAPAVAVEPEAAAADAFSQASIA